MAGGTVLLHRQSPREDPLANWIQSFYMCGNAQWICQFYVCWAFLIDNSEVSLPDSFPLKPPKYCWGDQRTNKSLVGAGEAQPHRCTNVPRRALHNAYLVSMPGWSVSISCLLTGYSGDLRNEMGSYTGPATSPSFDDPNWSSLQVIICDLGLTLLSLSLWASVDCKEYDSSHSNWKPSLEWR